MAQELKSAYILLLKRTQVQFSASHQAVHSHLYLQFKVIQNLLASMVTCTHVAHTWHTQTQAGTHIYTCCGKY
jgi:exosortase/archaeosortase